LRLAPELLADVERELGRISAVERVGGGCVSSAARVHGPEGSCFLKYERDAPPDFFAAEAHGLDRLRAAAGGLLRVPAVLALREAIAGWSWLALEWLEPGPRATGFAQRLARGIATLHRDVGEGWGLDQDGYIGRLVQRNGAGSSWSEFWWNRRLLPQLQMAARRGYLTPSERWARLESGLPALLSEAHSDGPSLLHGDLWNGNVIATAEGPALVDPASYRGHREVDLAMTELFGGFGSSFYEAYAEEWPLRPGYEARRGVYQLYYLLVHVNLFGGSYVGATNETLSDVLTAM
jgi:fructosamine-3-kinase